MGQARAMSTKAAADARRVVYEIELDDMRGTGGAGGCHAPAVFHGETYLGHNAGFRTCGGVPESVHRNDVQAAWLMRGKEAAQACVNRALRDTIEDYERTSRTYG